MEWDGFGLWPFVTRVWRWEKWLLRVGSSGFQLDPVMVKAESLGDRVRTLATFLLTEEEEDWGKPVERRERNPTGDGFAAMDKIGFSRVDIGFESDSDGGAREMS